MQREFANFAEMKPILKSQLRFIALSALMALLPLAVLFGVFYKLDPLHVFRAVDSPLRYAIIGNKGVLSTRNFERLQPERHFDSFIFGSSITISTPLDRWLTYLPEGASAYHFDSSSMSSDQMTEYLEYLVSRADVRNMYIILNRDMLERENPGLPAEVGDTPFMYPPNLYDNYLYKAKAYSLLWQKWLSAEFRYFDIRTTYIRVGKGGFTYEIKDTNTKLYDPETNTEYPVLQTPERDAEGLSYPFSLADSLAKYPPKIYPALLTAERQADFERFAAILDSAGTDYKLVYVTSASNSTPEPALLNPADSAALRRIFGQRFISAQWPTLEWWYNPYSTHDTYHFTTREAVKLLDYVYNDSLRAAHPGRL